MKKYKAILLISLSFFILLPSSTNAKSNLECEDEKTVDSDDKTYSIKTDKTCYYYLFSKYYDANNLYSTSYYFTTFPPITAGALVSDKEEIKLSLDCSKVKGDCMELEDFWNKWNDKESLAKQVTYKLKISEKERKEMGLEKDPTATGAYIEEGKIRYVLHASQTPAKEGDNPKNVLGGLSGGTLSKGQEDSAVLACATIRNKSNISPDNIITNSLDFYDLNGNNIYRSSVGGNYFIRIKRNITEDNKRNMLPISTANNSASPNTNTSKIQCNESIVPYNNQVYANAVYKVVIKNITNTCKETNTRKTPSCNDTGKWESKCGKHTIITSDGRADISLSQNAYITNILTPTTIYQGGGIKVGFTYYNEVTWNYDNIIEGSNKENLTRAIKDKFKSTTDIANGIKADISFIDDSGKEYKVNNPQVKCSRTGSFNENEKTNTACTIMLPASNIDLGTGEVHYNKDDANNKGINNEYYTPITYSGNLNLKATITGISISNDFGGWSSGEVTYDGRKDSSCSINVTSRLYNDTPSPNGNLEYKFIYRPIDINNPFPNRVAGVNWYEWYNNRSNKERLKNSYNNPKYQITLNNQSVTEIKQYNKDNNYLNWAGINKETQKSEFIDKYFSLRDEGSGNK